MSTLARKIFNKYDMLYDIDLIEKKSIKILKNWNKSLGYHEIFIFKDLSALRINSLGSAEVVTRTNNFGKIANF